jgi:hypothetical protein
MTIQLNRMIWSPLKLIYQSHLKNEEKVMKTGRKLAGTFIMASALFVLLVSCGRNGTETNKAIQEQDGAEIVALMISAQEALEEEDAERFQSLFSRSFKITGRTVWQRLMAEKASNLNDELIRLAGYPELERASTHLHVKRLILDMWFDLSRVYGARDNVYHTTWVFRRGTPNPEWKIENIKVQRASLAYGALLMDLNELNQPDFSALRMEWEESVDPTLLLIDTLKALADEDIESLKAFTLDGTLFHAYDNGIEMPTVANGNTVSGKHNREQSLTYLQQQIDNLRKGLAQLKMTAKGLEPYFTAYRILSMPAECTKLKLAMTFDGRGLSKNVSSLTLYWEAAQINEKWLAESMGIQSIQGYR